MMDQRVAEKLTEMEKDLRAIELDVIAGVYKLSDAIRDGAKYTEQERGWGDGVETACAFTAGIMAAKAKGYRV